MEPGAIHARLADWEEDGDLIRAVRREVFLVEQKVPEALDLDGSDPPCRHVLAFEGETPVGTARLGPEGRIGRMAVLASYRRRGVGRLLMNLLLDLACEEGLTGLHLHSQTHANPFYESFGFLPEGEIFIEADIPHQLMKRTLETK